MFLRISCAQRWSAVVSVSVAVSRRCSSVLIACTLRAASSGRRHVISGWPGWKHTGRRHLSGEDEDDEDDEKDEEEEDKCEDGWEEEEGMFVDAGVMVL